MGTCGWSDSTVVKCGKFYPGHARTSEDRLRYYATEFPTVEVDSSNYHLPKVDVVKTWVNAVPQHFKIHFKAFGMFTARRMAIESVPRFVREAISSHQDGGAPPKIIKWDQIPADAQEELWTRFNKCLEPAISANKMGAVLFQYPLGFFPSEDSKNYVLDCRRRLDARCVMAVEFRERTWISGQYANDTVAFCKAQGLVLVAADELEHETLMQQEPKGKAVVQSRLVTVTNPCMVYCRVHRREGCERVLSDAEMAVWKTDLEAVCAAQSELAGPVYFLWGTEHDDQPLINARKLTSLLGDVAYDWKRTIKQNGIASMFKKIASSNAAKPENESAVTNETTPTPIAAENKATSSTTPKATTPNADKKRTPTKAAASSASKKPNTAGMSQISSFFIKK